MLYIFLPCIIKLHHSLQVGHKTLAMEVLTGIVKRGSGYISFLVANDDKSRELQKFLTETILFNLMEKTTKMATLKSDCPNFSDSGNSFLLFSPLKFI